MYAAAASLPYEAQRLAKKADRLIGDNVKPPLPLFDRYDGNTR